MARTGVCLGAVNSYGRFPLAEIQLYFTIHMEKKIKEVVALSDVLQTAYVLETINTLQGGLGVSRSF